MAQTSSSQAYFSPEFFGFFTDLAKNNNREWFAKNKARYEAVVQDPCVRFIADVGPRLKTLSPHLVADPQPFGGSLSRIYRDIRFSKDKSPYKTSVSIHFQHRGGHRAGHHVPGLYLHLAPGESFAASGVWQPEPPALRKIRDAIVRRPGAWRSVLRSKPILEGEVLQRPPPGYDPDHPFIADLKRKDFVATVPFADRFVTSPRFMGRFLDAGRAMDPLNRFLASALGLTW